MNVEVKFDEFAKMWSLIKTTGNVRGITFWATEELAWESAGVPRPPGRMPVTDKDWE